MSIASDDEYNSALLEGETQEPFSNTRSQRTIHNTSDHSDSDSDSDSDSSHNRDSNREEERSQRTEATESTLLPPPEVSYPSYSDAQTAIQTWAKQHGYCLAITLTVRHPRIKQVYRRRFGCSQGRPQDTRLKHTTVAIRRTSSTKINCPMSLWLVANVPLRPEGSWTVKWYRGSRSHNHNHGALPIQAFAQHRRDERKEEAVNRFIESQIDAGDTAGAILSGLHAQFPNVRQTRQDINNLIKRRKRAHAQGKTTAEVTFELMQEKDFYVSYEASPENNQLNRLWITHPTSIELYRKNPELIFADCTYKTNKYNQPIFNLVGSTGGTKTFQIGIAILTGETREHFEWAFRQLKNMFSTYNLPYPTCFITDRDRACLNALDTIFPDVPSVLCSWHYRKDVLAWARQRKRQIPNPEYKPDAENANEEDAFTDHPDVVKLLELFSKAVDARTEPDFIRFQRAIETHWPEAARYLQREWWPDRKRFCHVWIDSYQHFGESATSRVEGAHKALKAYLKSNRNDIYSFITKLIPWWLDINNTINIADAQELLAVPEAFSTSFYAPTIRRIRKYALTRVEEEKKWANQLLQAKKLAQDRNQVWVRPECTGVHAFTLGRPCRHVILQMLEEQNVLNVNQFHKRWWIDRFAEYDDLTAPLLEFQTKSRRKTQTTARWQRMSATGAFGNRRDELAAEQIDLNSNSGLRRRKRLEPHSIPRSARRPRHNTLISATPTPTQSPSTPTVQSVPSMPSTPVTQNSSINSPLGRYQSIAPAPYAPAPSIPVPPVASNDTLQTLIALLQQERADRLQERDELRAQMATTFQSMAAGFQTYTSTTRIGAQGRTYQPTQPSQFNPLRTQSPDAFQRRASPQHTPYVSNVPFAYQQQAVPSQSQFQQTSHVKNVPFMQHLQGQGAAISQSPIRQASHVGNASFTQPVPLPQQQHTATVATTASQPQIYQDLYAGNIQEHLFPIQRRHARASSYVAHTAFRS